ncbi:MAG TPA: FUSC family protein [Rhodanobacteraceae bacterium]|nr:FUSC family protein [Rhodanobacteraceae bacterium]
MQDATPPRRQFDANILASLHEAAVTMLAAMATLAAVLAIDPEASAGVLAVVLGISLARSHLDHGVRERLEAAVALPLVALVAASVGLLLVHWPWIGALVFTAGIAVSIWLRRFGALAARAGSLIALPFVTLLVTPYSRPTKVGPVLAMLMPVIVALIALASVTLFQTLARRIGVLAPAKLEPHVEPPAKSEGGMRPDATTRMAIQMAVALAVSFVVGYAFFAERWSWIVLTAFIVQSGNRGRLDVAYKSVLRVAGAAGGTVVALVSAMHLGSHDAATIALILAAVFLGLWLRPLGYAWWALFVTVALALLQGFTGAPAEHILWPRLEEIVIGAIISVVAAWFVLPVRSTAVLRRRIADALAALSEALDPAASVRTPDAFVAALARVDQVGAAFKASRIVTSRLRRANPADWIDALTACRAPAIVLIDAGATPAAIRKLVGGARKAVQQPPELLAALTDLRRALTA